MKNLPHFLTKNSLSTKMIKKGIGSFCSSIGSISTLNQRSDDNNLSCIGAPSQANSLAVDSNITWSPPSLEQMLVQLELEEAAARRVNMNDYEELLHRRMSCVNNADILRTARNALNQHPRFSLDGRDSMYRSTFRNEGGQRPVQCSDFGGKHCIDGYDLDRQRCYRPSIVGGENVMWCKPGVVATLMGLDAVPVPVGRRHRERRLNASLISRKKQDLRRKEKFELESKMVALGLRVHGQKGRTKMEHLSSCLAYDQYMLSPGPKFS